VTDGDVHIYTRKDGDGTFLKWKTRIGISAFFDFRGSVSFCREYHSPNSIL